MDRGEALDAAVAESYAAWLNGAGEHVLWSTFVANKPERNFPGGSRERVTRAGENLRNQVVTEDDLAVIDTWRAAHRRVLNSFQAILRKRTRGSDIIVAQRHKRKRTIFDKLQRFPRMQLGRMDDVAGCRLIFPTIDELRDFRASIHGANFNHKLRNHPDKYDYIANPKPSGYRGIHDIYDYDVKSETGKDFKGLLIELQYRTMYQHAWATSVEVVGHITEHQPKFERGDNRYQEIFCLASEIISRTFEGMPSCLPHMHGTEVVQRFVELDGQLRLMQMLRGLNAADRQITDNKNMILIIGQEPDELEILTFPDATVALRALFELERQNPGKDMVLVKGDRPEDVREAFKNYFSDAREFIHFVEEGCQRMAGRRYLELANDRH